MHSLGSSGQAFFAMILTGVLCGCSPRAERSEEAKSNPNPAPGTIYDTKADGEKQISDALRIASRENKRVLLKFGANWCVWCHKLHKVFKDDARVAAKLRDSYELVLIDVDVVDGMPHNEKVDEKYGKPTQNGLPVLIVLDAQGKVLTTRSTEAFEAGEQHDPAKVFAFLDQWAPPRT